jgi:hypothetical protein
MEFSKIDFFVDIILDFSNWFSLCSFVQYFPCLSLLPFFDEKEDKLKELFRFEQVYSKKKRFFRNLSFNKNFVIPN